MSIADKLTTIAENEQKVYDKGVEDGRTQEWSDFWDYYQNNGKAQGYNYAFAGTTWVNDIFRPKHNFVCTTTQQMFFQSAITDLAGLLDSRGLTFDTSRVTWSNQMFMHSSITHIPTINMSKSAGDSANNYMFYSQSIHTIDKIVMAETVAYGAQIFGLATGLKNLTIEGVIGRTLSISSSPLTVESAKSVINALKNYAGTDKELTYKLTLNSTVWTALNNAETPPSGETWKEYVQTLGWQCA